MTGADAWLGAWQLWAAAGLLMVLVDIFVSGSGHLIALGCASFFMAALAGVSQAMGLGLVPGWKVAVVEYAVMSVLALVVLRLLRHPPEDDLNTY